MPPQTLFTVITFNLAYAGVLVRRFTSRAGDQS
ncbi:MAG: hypothetical protein HW378_4502 [Anaerolineales bacterium]|nr:hypothetical protein [Anaerolineales bacterium]